MIKKKCCIICDNPKRDLPGVIYLAKNLIDLNYEVFVVNSYAYFEIFFINPDIIFLNHIRPIYHYLAKILLKKNKKVFIIDQEGGFLGHSENLKYKKFDIIIPFE